MVYNNEVTLNNPHSGSPNYNFIEKTSFHSQELNLVPTCQLFHWTEDLVKRGNMVFSIELQACMFPSNYVAGSKNQNFNPSYYITLPKNHFTKPPDAPFERR